MNVKYILIGSLLAIFLVLAYVFTFIQPVTNEDIRYNYQTNDFDVDTDPTVQFGEEYTLVYQVAVGDK